MHKLALRLNLLRIGALLALGLANFAPALATTYRWVDQNGKVQYSDVMPPNQAGQGHAELDKQGRVVKETRRNRLSPEEQKRQAETAARANADKRKQEALRRRDQALLATYTSETEIDLAQNRAIELENLNIRGLKTRQNAAAAKLALANANLARAGKSGQSEHSGHVQMRNEAQRELAQIAEAIRVRETAIENIKVQFAQDAKRFLELKAQESKTLMR